MRMITRIAIFLYGIIAYIGFLVIILATVAFTSNIFLQNTLDAKSAETSISNIIFNISLIGLFGIQHTVMARGWYKEKLTKVIPQYMERSTFVLISNIVLALILWQWRALDMVIYDWTDTVFRIPLMTISYLGWVIVVISTFLISHFRLLGLSQSYEGFREREVSHDDFQIPFLYKFVRHPLLAGLIIAFWVTPIMTLSHFIFAAGFTIYMLIGINFEERDLIEVYGDEYIKYQESVSKLIPGVY